MIIWLAYASYQTIWTTYYTTHSYERSLKRCFQYDSALKHFSLNVWNTLDTTFNGWWIGRGSSIAWPTRSLDVLYLDFFLWGHMKSQIYECPTVTNIHLVSRIAIIASNIWEMPGACECASVPSLQVWSLHYSWRTFF